MKIPTFAGSEFVVDGAGGVFNPASPLTASNKFIMEARLTPIVVSGFDFALGNTDRRRLVGVDQRSLPYFVS
ncbi:MAG: hypothetical protein ACPGJR_00225 [Akkermansiaceae bacterium]